jgi:predicted ATPase
VCHSYASWVLWLLGYSDQARTSSCHALTLAQELSHPFSLVYALGSASTFHYNLRDVEVTHVHAEATIALATEHGFPFWWATGMMRRGWALAKQGQGAEGLEQIHQGLTTRLATGTEEVPTTFLAGLAESYGSAGQAEAGLHVLARAFTAMARSGSQHYEPEVYRLKGELLLHQAVLDEKQAEACFFQALGVARHQQAKSLELRAAMSLSRLWQQQGKRAEAYALLAPIYGWFTEGFDTADLQEAKALLAVLEREQS